MKKRVFVIGCLITLVAFIATAWTFVSGLESCGGKHDLSGMCWSGSRLVAYWDFKPDVCNSKNYQYSIIDASIVNNRWFYRGISLSYSRRAGTTEFQHQYQGPGVYFVNSSRLRCPGYYERRTWIILSWGVLAALFILLVAPFIALSIRNRVRRMRRLRLGHCSKCGYDLSGNTSGACPECGTSTCASPTQTEPRR